MSPAVTLLTLVALLTLQCHAAPRPFTPEEMAAANLDFPTLERRADNSTAGAWLPRLGRREHHAEAISSKKVKLSPVVGGKVPLLPTLPAKATPTKAGSTQKTTSKSSTKSAAQVLSTTAQTSNQASATSTSYPKLASVPANVQTLYNQLASKQCQNQLDTNPHGYQANGDGGNWAHYCGDSKEDPNVVYWMSNMDVDCDGATKAGPCGSDPSHESQTAFTYKNKALDALSVPYVVINDDQYFDPAHFGIEGLGVVGVVCGGKLTWGIFGDTNAILSMGEASVDLARTCFGDSMNGNNGWSPANVLYFAFPGSYDELAGTNYQELAAIGNRLLSRL